MLIFFILNLKKKKTKNNSPLILLSIQRLRYHSSIQIFGFYSTKEVSVNFFILNLMKTNYNSHLSIQGFSIYTLDFTKEISNKYFFYFKFKKKITYLHFLI